MHNAYATLTALVPHTPVIMTLDEGTFHTDALDALQTLDSLAPGETFNVAVGNA